MVMPKKPNAMRRERIRASRGADPKRPTEPRPAQGRLDTQVELTAPLSLGGGTVIEVRA